MEIDDVATADAVQEPEWIAKVVVFSKQLVTGDCCSGLLMYRRNQQHQAEYRRPTPLEEQEYLSTEAW